MVKTDLHTEIFTIEHFLSNKECEKWLEFTKGIEFEESLIQSGGKQVMNKSVRNNERHLFFDEGLAGELWERLKPFFPECIGNVEPFGLNEMFRIYKYTKGQRFKTHRDGSYQRNGQEFSLYSLIIYLNTDFKGGETSFRNLFSVLPDSGKALLFNHSLLHEGKEIHEGVKYVLRTDIMFKLKSV